MSISKQKIERFISTQLIQWLNGKRNDKLLISKLVQTYSDWAKAGWSLSLYKFWIGDVEGLGVGYDDKVVTRAKESEDRRGSLISDVD